MLKMGKH